MNVWEEYLLEKDKEIIESWAKKKNVSISFRSAGPATLQCLIRGAGAKPHSILEKTIKTKEEKTEGDKRNNESVKRFLEQFPTAKSEYLRGMVGHWEAGAIAGIYVTEAGKAALSGQFDLETNFMGMPYLTLRTGTDQVERFGRFMEEALPAEGSSDKEELKKEYFFSRMFFSGDYDTHDLLQVGTSIPSERDMEFLSDLQKELIESRKSQLIAKYGLSDDDFAGEKDGEYQRVQHGPQFNYISQMLEENRKAKEAGKLSFENLNVLVNSVADMDTPVLIYDDRPESGEENWKVLEDNEALKEFYKKKGQTLKMSWNSQEERDKHIGRTIRDAVVLILKTHMGGAVTAVGIRDELVTYVNGIYAAVGIETKGLSPQQQKEMQEKKLMSFVEEIMETLDKEKKYFQSVNKSTSPVTYTVKSASGFGTINN